MSSKMLRSIQQQDSTYQVVCCLLIYYNCQINVPLQLQRVSAAGYVLYDDTYHNKVSSIEIIKEVEAIHNYNTLLEAPEHTVRYQGE